MFYKYVLQYIVILNGNIDVRGENVLSETSSGKRYRSDIEIFYEILKNIIDAGEFGIKKTHLMYKTNLNSKMLAKYLNILKEAGVIEEEKFKKQKLVKLSPLGKTAYAALRILMTILKPMKPRQEVEFIKEELMRLTKKGWMVRSGIAIDGRTGADYLPDVIIRRKMKTYMVRILLGNSSMESQLLLVNFMVAVIDTGCKGIVITDDERLANLIPDKLKDDIKVVSTRPLETLADRVAEVIEEWEKA